MANTCSELNHTLNRNHTSNSYIQKSDRFIDTFLYANTKSENNENLLALVEKEVDDDETESHKTKITKKFHSVSIFNYRDATIAISEINNGIYVYSHSEEIFKCWYKLYQVFRI